MGEGDIVTSRSHGYATPQTWSKSSVGRTVAEQLEIRSRFRSPPSWRPSESVTTSKAPLWTACSRTSLALAPAQVRRPNFRACAEAERSDRPASRHRQDATARRERCVNDGSARPPRAKARIARGRFGAVDRSGCACCPHCASILITQGNDGPRTGHLLSLLANLLSIPPPTLSAAQDAIARSLGSADTLDALGRVLNSKRHAQASSALRLLGEMVRVDSSRARKIWTGLGLSAPVRRACMQHG